MREYRFRGKRIDNSEWVYGDLIHERYGTCIQYTTKRTPTGYGAPEAETITEMHKVTIDPETVGQYTGLHDKNGKEIYEGDILEEEPGYYFEVIWSVECAKFKLQWRTKAIQYPEWNRGVNMTVIGNRWENPELPKEVEEG